MGRLKLRRNKAGGRGPIPTEPQIWGDVVVEKRPSDDWLALNKAALDRGDIVEPDDDDMFIGLNIYGHYAVPNPNVPPNLWKQGRTLLLTCTEVPYAEFRAECLADIERQNPTPQSAEEHKAELADVGAAALAAHRAAKALDGTTAVDTETDAGKVLANAVKYVLPLPYRPWWRRLLGRY